MVMPAVVNVMKEEATLVTLIKPQFEAPRSQPLCSKKKPVSLVYSLQEKLEKERESYKEMEVGRRKRITWESRMKSDELNGGLKIFHGEEENSEESHPKTQTGFQRISQTHNKLQSLVDLVMWRDVSKSAFVFGIGTFIIIASSYTKDINIRGVIGGDDTNQDYVVGEEEAVWLVKMILPYLNEFLLKFRALFYGDPATTMKLAIMLFVLARFGSTITIWKMAKLGIFWSIQLTKDMLILFHAHHCLWFERCARTPTYSR